MSSAVPFADFLGQRAPAPSRAEQALDELEECAPLHIQDLGKFSGKFFENLRNVGDHTSKFFENLRNVGDHTSKFFENLRDVRGLTWRFSKNRDRASAAEKVLKELTKSSIPRLSVL